MYDPFDIADSGTPAAVSNKKHIVRVISALLDISRESSYGILNTDMLNGITKNYSKEDLDRGYRIY
jgi:hypothetical protein